MPLASPLKLAAALLVGLSLDAAALAQDAGQPARTWTDPPARGAAATPVAKPAAEEAKAKAKAPAAASSRSAENVKPVRAAGRSGRHVSRQARRVSRTPVAAARPRPHRRTLVVTAVHPTRHGSVRRMEASGYRLARTSAPAAVYDLPVGTVETGAPFTAAPFDDRADRIRAARAAGYIVMHARSVRFPDGRSLRTYSPIGEEREED